VSDYVSALATARSGFLQNTRTAAPELSYWPTASRLSCSTNSGLATASTESMMRGSKPVEVLRVKITEAGRLALQ
jgi:hypothetical protein